METKWHNMEELWAVVQESLTLWSALMDTEQAVLLR